MATSLPIAARSGRRPRAGVAILPCVLALSGAGCSASKMTTTAAAVSDDVRTVAGALIAADNRRDLDAVMTCYADDVVWLPPEGPMIRGRDAIRPRYARMFANWQPDMKMTIDDVRVDCKLAIVTGRIDGRLESRSDQDDIPVGDKFLMVLHQLGDRWQVIYLMWSPVGP